MKFKGIIIILALIGLVAACLFVGYLVGIKHPKEAPPNPLLMTVAGKQVAAFQQKIQEEQKAAEEKMTSTSKDSKAEMTQKEKEEKTPASMSGAAQKKEPQKKQEKMSQKPVDNESKEKMKTPEKKQPENSAGETPKEKEQQSDKKEDEIPLRDPEELSAQLRSFYVTGKLEEGQKDSTQKKRLLKNYYIRGENAYKSRLEMLRVWDEGDKNISPGADWKTFKYNSLNELNSKFDLQEIQKRYQLPKKPNSKQYAQAMNKIVSEPWYSRVYY